MKSSHTTQKRENKATAESGRGSPVGEVAKPGGTARLRDDSDATPARRNITLQLNEDSSPKWETVTEKNRAAWREILMHSATVKALGLASPAAEAGPPAAALLPAGAAGALFDAVARIEALACSQVFKIPFSECSPLLAFSKEEKAELVPLLQLLAEKYIPLAAEKYGAEVAFAAQLGTMTIHKLEAVKALAAERKTSAPSAPEPAAESEGTRPN